MAVVVGAGNIVRGQSLVENGFKNAVQADNMGMVATALNAIFLAELMNQRHPGVAKAMSKVAIRTMIEDFSYNRAVKEMSDGNIVIIGGGTGNPGVTTDSGVVTAAYQLHCREVVKTTKTPGIFTKDPFKYPDAEHIPRISLEQALADPDINVMDKTALAFAQEHSITIAVCMPDPDHVIEVLDEDVTHGSLVTP